MVGVSRREQSACVLKTVSTLFFIWIDMFTVSVCEVSRICPSEMFKEVVSVSVVVRARICRTDSYRERHETTGRCAKGLTPLSLMRVHPL